MDRTILHCDMNGFFASVELLFRPDLRGKPVAVCGNPKNRHGIILAKSEEAKACGVVTAETIWQAKKKCPDLILIPPHHEKYREYSLKINEIYCRFTDMVEPFSIDESWLDVTASRQLFGSGVEIADQIRETVKRELGLTLSAGVSFNKIFAKMGSDYKKPDATTEISRENYKEILWPMAVEEMFFVGKATAARLRQMGIRTIGDLAWADEALLIAALGKQGKQIREYARGEEQTPVSRYEDANQIKSVGNGMTFRRNLVGIDDCKVAITALSDKVATRLRKYALKGNGVKVDIKDPYFKTISRQKQLSGPTNLKEEISKAALELVGACWSMENPIRLLTVTVIGLQPENAAEQLSFFTVENRGRQKQEQVERTMDSIRQKYGSSAITFGGIVKNDIGIELYEEEENEKVEKESV